MSGYLAFRKSPWLPLLLGFMLSASLEMFQLFVPGRTTSAVDVLANTIGTVVGIALGVVLEKIAGPQRVSARIRVARLKAADPSALILLFLWVGLLLFPFFPQVGLSAPVHRIRLFFNAPLFAAVPLITAAVSWFAAGELMNAARIRSCRWLLGFSILAIPLQFFIVNHQPVPSDLLGAAIGFLLFVGLGRIRIMTRCLAAAFLLAILIRGFAPFHFVAQPAEFSWIPFSGFLNTEWQYGLLVLIEKSYYYGTAIWLLHASGLRLTTAALVTAALLAIIEIAQTHLPGRTPEITDPVLAIVLAFALGVLSRQTPGARS